jgi:hypothetical protein
VFVGDWLFAFLRGGAVERSGMTGTQIDVSNCNSICSTTVLSSVYEDPWWFGLGTEFYIERQYRRALSDADIEALQL